MTHLKRLEALERKHLERKGSPGTSVDRAARIEEQRRRRSILAQLERPPKTEDEGVQDES